jgi:hypothetical protein
MVLAKLKEVLAGRHPPLEHHAGGLARPDALRNLVETPRGSERICDI